MTLHSYLVPTIAVGPPEGYSLGQFLPLDQLREIINVDDAVLEVRWDLYSQGERVLSKGHDLVLEDGRWTNPEVAEFQFEGPAVGDWLTGEHVSYLELSVNQQNGQIFSSNAIPSLYTVYAGKNRKTMLSDNSMKFADNLVINQIAAFGQWVVGYPACEVDRGRDVDDSVVLLNPFDRPAVVNIDLSDSTASRRVRVDPKSGRRISLSSLLDDRSESWAGQVIVHGVNRLVVFIAMHSYTDPSRLSTLEHIDLFRGAKLTMPVTHYLHWRLRSRRGLAK